MTSGQLSMESEIVNGLSSFIIVLALCVAKLGLLGAEIVI